jgi:signal transduction histidine kinase
MDARMNTAKLALFSQDDQMLEGAGRQVMAEVNRFFSKERLEQGERLRLARELHDGVLQSLAGAALQLEALSRLMEADPKAAQERLRAIEALIAEEQRELRGWIEKAQPSAPASIATAADLTAALDKLRERGEWQWGFRVELAVDGSGTVPRMLGDEIYRIVQEALTNAGRHAHARAVRISVELDMDSGRVYITASDDGCGFPFRGRYELAELTTRRIGPRSLRERVAALRGELVLNSELSGSRLEITLPIAQPSVRRPARNVTTA